MTEQAGGKGSSGRLGRALVLFALAAAVAAYFVFPSYKNLMDSIFAAFASGDFAVMRNFVAKYGAWAAAVSFFLMIFQSIAAPLPAFLITLANANLFGWWRGAVLSWSSAMAGAAVCFAIARVLGRSAAERLASRAGLQSIDAFFQRYGTHSILIARLLPFISFDLVSYAAGLTSMRFWPFFVATGVGQLPATLVYSYVGGMLTGGAQMLVTGLLILFALSALAVLLRQMHNERQMRQGTKPEREEGFNARVFICFYNALLWGLLLAVLLYQNTWLEMRVNLGWVFFGLALILFALQAGIRPLRRACGAWSVATASLIAVCAGCWLLLGPEGLPVVPASIIREGLMRPRLPFRVVNAALGVLIVGGWLLSGVLSRRCGRKGEGAKA